MEGKDLLDTQSELFKEIFTPTPGSECEERAKRGEYRHVEYGYEFVPDDQGNMVGNFYEREQR
jgi:hypothetical protein